MKGSRRKIILVVSILVSGLLTLNLSTFTNPILILTLPGLLFGLALTIPNIHPNYKSKKNELIIGLAYPALWAISFAMSFMIQMVSTSISDKTPYIIIGLVSGIVAAITFDWQFGFKKRILGLFIITALSLIAVLFGDFLFPNPLDKELNIGKQIAIWELLVGLGLILNRKEKTPANKTYKQSELKG